MNKVKRLSIFVVSALLFFTVMLACTNGNPFIPASAAETAAEETIDPPFYHGAYGSYCSVEFTFAGSDLNGGDILFSATNNPNSATMIFPNVAYGDDYAFSVSNLNTTDCQPYYRYAFTKDTETGEVSEAFEIPYDDYSSDYAPTYILEVGALGAQEFIVRHNHFNKKIYFTFVYNGFSADLEAKSPILGTNKYTCVVMNMQWKRNEFYVEVGPTYAHITSQNELILEKYLNYFAFA